MVERLKIVATIPNSHCSFIAPFLVLLLAILEVAS